MEDPSSLNLDEVEKTAELLDALSEEDTLMDDLARLAVLQDMSKEGGLLGKARRSAKNIAKKDLKTARKAKDIAEVQADTARIMKETEALNRKAGIVKDNKMTASSIADVAIPAVVGAGVGTIGAGVYFKKREEKMLSDFEQYVRSLQAKQNK